MSTDLVPAASDALVPFAEQSYVARRNVFNWFGLTCRILSNQGQLLYFVKLKAFRLKEDITVFADMARTQPLLNIKARSIIDWGAAYDVTDATTGEKVGVLRRKGWKSMVRDEWEILDAFDQPFGRVREDSQLLALLRRFLVALIPQEYHVEANGVAVGHLRGTWNPFVVKYWVDWTDQANGVLDPRLRVAIAVLLMCIEGKQGGY